MKVMIVGSGGREHALAWKLVQSPRLSKLWCLPGNAGTEDLGENVDIDPANLDAVVAFAAAQRPDLTVVGPEAALCAGIVDRFQRKGLRIFGPCAAAARIEGDKAHGKHLMRQAAIPTAEARVFRSPQDAKEYVATREFGLVVKAAGLAGGKGSFVCDDPSQALLVVERLMDQGELGPAAQTVLIEEKLTGPEMSVMALVQDADIYVLETVQDYKTHGEGDTGPNTGGMGAVSPAPAATPEVMDIAARDILVPIVDIMRREETPFSGLLYAGLILTHAGPKVLEFNCRFGDPETQTLMLRLRTDLLEVLDAATSGRLSKLAIEWDPRPAACVVMASGGYPGKFEAGKVIDGLDIPESPDGPVVFPAGTRRLGEYVVTDGGRVLSVGALGADLAEARRAVYDRIKLISFEGAYYRRDIGEKRVGSPTERA